MDFTRSRPDVVRSVTQRWLVNNWLRLRGNRSCPAWDDLDTDELKPQADTVMFCDVVANGGLPRFLIRYHGERIAQSYGGDCVGKFLDEVLPPAWRDGAMATYREAVRGQHPVYNVVDTRDPDGRLVHMERLLLPFSQNGDAPDRVLASIETVSLDGKFDQHGLAKSPYLSNSCAFVAVIATE
jgi:hypothetical protein